MGAGQLLGGTVPLLERPLADRRRLCWPGQQQHACRQSRRRGCVARLLPWQQAWNTGITVDSQAPPLPAVAAKWLREWLSLTSIAMQTLAANLFASSIVPYAGFLWHFHRSRQAPRLTLFGFYWLLVFVGVTIPAGIIGARHMHGCLCAGPVHPGPDRWVRAQPRRSTTPRCPTWTGCTGALSPCSR